MTRHRFFLTALLALTLAACGGNPPVPDPEPSDAGMADTGDSDASSRGRAGGGLGEGEAFGDDPMGRGEMENIIYFDFDQSELRPEYGDLLARHAQNLANNANLKVRLEGHADERGSREYNIGLGERRSQSVRRMLLIQGAAADQISTVSFGEERPAALGSDEEAYAQNRRVEIKYTN
jgi:peptidoglycan-associated lipoprotein